MAELIMDDEQKVNYAETNIDLKTIESEFDKEINSPEFTPKKKRERSEKSSPYTRRVPLKLLRDDRFSPWLDLSPHDTSKAYCKTCNTEISGSRSQIERHGKTEKHKKSVKLLDVNESENASMKSETIHPAPEWLGYAADDEGNTNSNLWCAFCSCFLRPRKDSVERHAKTARHIKASQHHSMQEIPTDDKGRVIVARLPIKNKQSARIQSIAPAQSIETTFGDEIHEMNEITIEDNDPEHLAHSVFSNMEKPEPKYAYHHQPSPREPSSYSMRKKMVFDDDMEIFGKFVASEMRTAVKFPQLRSRLKRQIQMDILNILDEQRIIDKKIIKKRKERGYKRKQQTDVDYDELFDTDNEMDIDEDVIYDGALDESCSSAEVNH